MYVRLERYALPIYTYILFGASHRHTHTLTLTHTDTHTQTHTHTHICVTKELIPIVYTMSPTPLSPAEELELLLHRVNDLVEFRIDAVLQDISWSPVWD